MAGRDRRSAAAARCRIVVVAAEQIGRGSCRRSGCGRRGVGILRAAIVLRERGQHRAALVVAIGAAEAAAAQPLQIAGDLIEIGAHLLDLVVDRTALRRAAVEQREEAGAFAAHALGLQGDAIEFALLPGGRVLIAADLLVLARDRRCRRGRSSQAALPAAGRSD